MGKHAPSNRDNELRIEKLFLRRGLVEKLKSGRLLRLEDFVSFVWHTHPNYVSNITLDFLRELIAYRREGKPYTQDDWVRFCGKISNSKSNRDIVLYKLLYLGLIEKRNKTLMRYEIRLSDKWIDYLGYMARSWVVICENEQASKV
jgi:hypothetical protein